MKPILGVLLFAAACVPPKKVDGPRATELPFSAPAVEWTDDPQTGYHVEIASSIQRDLKPTDGVFFVVRVGADEVGKFPIAGPRGAQFRQRLDLPLGDYDVAIEYQGRRYAGEPFRIAVVPEWGGTKNLHLFRHHGTRVSLRDRRLWILRWWANEAPARPWIIEWRHDGRAITTTQGRDMPWHTQDASAFVHDVGKLGAARRSIWQLGEEYVIPDAVASQPGAWEARVVHEGTPPLAVDFTVSAGGQLADATPDLVLTREGWSHAWSKSLDSHTLSEADVLDLEEKMAVMQGAQRMTDGPIPLTVSAVRALFRSKQLGESWSKYLDVGLHSPQRALRTEVEQLIQKFGGPWKPEEMPRS
jgi:hypothetical protein